MTRETLVIVTDGKGSFGYAHNTEAAKAAKQAKSNIGVTPHHAIGYEYPAEWIYHINHYPIGVSFSKKDGVLTKDDRVAEDAIAEYEASL